MMGKGNHKGCPYGGVDGVVVVEPVRQLGGRGSRTAPTAQSRRWWMMGKGNHKGLPLRGVDVVVVVERVRQFGRAVPEPSLRRKVGWMGDDGEGYGGWIPASAGKTDVGVGGSRIAPMGRVRGDGFLPPSLRG